MGNRAVITTTRVGEPKYSNEIGVYLHWNGGRDSVEAFLEYCRLKGYRCPEQDNYGWARLCQVIGNFFGGGCSIGIDRCCNLDCDNGDNGTYIIENWEIVDRKYYDYEEEQQNYPLSEMLIDIDDAQPKHEQLGDFLKSVEVSIDELKKGDRVYFYNGIYNTYEVCTVVGFGENTHINGHNVYGIPYVNKYGDESRGYSWNINNYIRTSTVRVCR